jgi:hypothetical protein
MKRFALVAAVVLAGCGGSTSPTTNGLTGSASITLSGAQTGSFTANNVVSAWNTASSQGAFGMSVLQAASTSTPGIAVAITFPGEPHTGHFLSTGTGAAGAVSVNPSGNIFWAATSSTASGAQGSYDLNLTSVSSAATVNGGKTYTVSGTLDATVTAITGSGATGTVTLHATF